MVFAKISWTELNVLTQTKIWIAKNKGALPIPNNYWTT